MRDPTCEAARNLAGTTGGDDQTPQDTRLLLNTADAAEWLDISPRKLTQLRTDGAIPFVRIGALVKYPVAALKAWVVAGCPTDADAADRLDWNGGGA